MTAACLQQTPGLSRQRLPLQAPPAPSAAFPLGFQSPLAGGRGLRRAARPGNCCEEVGAPGGSSTGAKEGASGGGEAGGWRQQVLGALLLGSKSPALSSRSRRAAPPPRAPALPAALSQKCGGRWAYLGGLSFGSRRVQLLPGAEEEEEGCDPEDAQERQSQAATQASHGGARRRGAGSRGPAGGPGGALAACRRPGAERSARATGAASPAEPPRRAWRRTEAASRQAAREEAGLAAEAWGVPGRKAGGGGGGGGERARAARTGRRSGGGGQALGRLSRRALPSFLPTAAGSAPKAAVESTRSPARLPAAPSLPAGRPLAIVFLPPRGRGRPAPACLPRAGLRSSPPPRRALGRASRFLPRCRRAPRRAAARCQAER